MCAMSAAITSSPGRQCTSSAIWLHMVPEGRNTAASLPRSAATRSCRALVVGSSPFCSSPTSASAMALRMPGEGRVAVSLKRSMSLLDVIGGAPGDRRIWNPFFSPATSLARSCACGCGVRAVHRTFVLVLSAGNTIREEPMLRPGAFSALPLLASMMLSMPSPAAAQSRAEAKDMALVGYNDLQARSAYQPTIHSQGGRWIAYIGHHGGTKEIPKPRNPLTGARRIQRHVAHRRHRPAPAQVPVPYSGRRGAGRGRRRADGARVRRQGPAEGRSRAPSTCCARSATRRTRSGTRPIPPRRSSSRGSPASRARTRTGGSATPASPIWSRASRDGAWTA